MISYWLSLLTTEAMFEGSVSVKGKGKMFRLSISY